MAQEAAVTENVEDGSLDHNMDSTSSGVPGQLPCPATEPTQLPHPHSPVLTTHSEELAVALPESGDDCDDYGRPWITSSDESTWRIHPFPAAESESDSSNNDDKTSEKPEERDRRTQINIDEETLAALKADRDARNQRKTVSWADVEEEAREARRVEELSMRRFTSYRQTVKDKLGKWWIRGG